MPILDRIIGTGSRSFSFYMVVGAISFLAIVGIWMVYSVFDGWLILYAGIDVGFPTLSEFVVTAATWLRDLLPTYVTLVFVDAGVGLLQTLQVVIYLFIGISVTALLLYTAIVILTGRSQPGLLVISQNSQNAATDFSNLLLDSTERLLEWANERTQR